jgi:hypothetical protein
VNSSRYEFRPTRSKEGGCVLKLSVDQRIVAFEPASALEINVAYFTSSSRRHKLDSLSSGLGLRLRLDPG